MASMKLGSKSDAFQRQGQAWFCTTGLPSDVVVEVDEMSFHLHKFPLLSRSGLMEKLIAKASVEGEETCVVKIPEIPGGAKTFEIVAKFCYGIRLELTASNVVYLRCTAQQLEMTEEYGENNLISVSENFLNQIVLKNWKDSLKALQTCDGLIEPEDYRITERCIESLSVKAVNEPNLFGWPITERSGPMQSVLWNGIDTGVARSTHSSSSDWWYEDVSTLSLNLYKKLVSSMESRGIKHEILAGSLVSYATRYLPGLKRRHSASSSGNLVTQVSSVNILSENDQKLLLEDVELLFPMQKGLVSTKFLFGLIRTAKILKASPLCITNLEQRIGMQLDEASLDDLLLPNFSYSKETLYDVDCVQRILERFLATDQVTGGGAPSPCSIIDDYDQRMGSPSLMPVTMVAKLIDGYLAEVAPDINLKLPEFLSLAGAIPEYARPLDDGLYRAIDVYLKSHPWLVESERELLSRLLDCQKLSLEACTHAAQNERLPLRVLVQVLFFEQLQLKTSIAGCFLLSGNLDGSRNLRSGLIGPNDGGWASTVRENQLLKVGMDSMRTRVSELEKECLSMKQEIKKLGQGKTASDTWGDIISKKLGFKLKSQICSNGEEGSVKNMKIGNGKGDEAQDKLRKHKKKQHFED